MNRMPPIKQFKTLDVRPILARGEEPCAAVRRKVNGLQEGDGLLVRSPFLPSPLIEWLGSEGYFSRLERGGDGCWIVYFWREPAEAGL
jgi:hypothetical protein